jgi:hypothetical protein
MNLQLASVIVSFFAPMLMLMLALGVIAQKMSLKPRGIGWCVGLGLVSLGVLMIPIGNLPMARAFAGIVDHWSVPTLAVLLAAVAKTFFNAELLRTEDRNAMWLFGVAAGLVLYPLALGLGAIDPVAHGWSFGLLTVLVGIVAMLLQWSGNRLGIVLALSFGAWLVGAAESGNFWDCLIDPVFFVISMICGVTFLRKKRAKSGS